MEEQKRVFFGFEVCCPWPEKLPQGRQLEESNRHMTLAFLGNVNFPKLSTLLPQAPLPTFKVGITGIFDQCLFLPERHPHVVAWHVDWLDQLDPLLTYQKNLVAWLQSHGFSIDTRDFLPHVTVCRSPFKKEAWKKAFSPLPLMIKNLHLYESKGNLHYQSCWHYPLISPFEEISHTADVAFAIFGESLNQLYTHAKTALAFKFPEIIPFFSDGKEIENIDDLIIRLNQAVSKADEVIRSPFKAVSFHGDIQKKENEILKWEMIVDV